MAKKAIIGYEQIKGNKFVPIERALAYVLEQCGIAIVDDGAPSAEEFQKDLVEWFFSGNWVEVMA